MKTELESLIYDWVHDLAHIKKTLAHLDDCRDIHFIQVASRILCHFDERNWREVLLEQFVLSETSLEPYSELILKKIVGGMDALLESFMGQAMRAEAEEWLAEEDQERRLLLKESKGELI